MRYRLSTLPSKPFANPDVLSLAALPAHDAAITGDTLTTISLNQEWRAILTGALEQYWNQGESDTISIDNYDLLMAFYNDLYD